jgi:hypothetical protein
MLPGIAPPSLTRLRSAGLRFGCPEFDPVSAPGNALTLDNAPTDDCTVPDAFFWSAGFFSLFTTESVSTPF